MRTHNGWKHNLDRSYFIDVFGFQGRGGEGKGNLDKIEKNSTFFRETTTKQWKIGLLDESRLIWAAIFTCTKIVSARGVYWMMGPALSSGLLACAHQWACNCPASTRAPSLSKINKISCLRWEENKRLNMVWWEKKTYLATERWEWSINKWDRRDQVAVEWKSGTGELHTDTRQEGPRQLESAQ